MFGKSTTTDFINGETVETMKLSTGLVEENLFVFNFEVFARFTRGVFISAQYRGEWGSGQTLNEARCRLGYYF